MLFRSQEEVQDITPAQPPAVLTIEEETPKPTQPSLKSVPETLESLVQPPTENEVENSEVPVAEVQATCDSGDQPVATLEKIVEDGDPVIIADPVIKASTKKKKPAKAKGKSKKKKAKKDEENKEE